MDEIKSEGGNATLNPVEEAGTPVVLPVEMGMPGAETKAFSTTQPNPVPAYTAYPAGMNYPPVSGPAYYYTLPPHPQNRSVLRLVIALVGAVVFLVVFFSLLILVIGWSNWGWNSGPGLVTTETKSIPLGQIQNTELNLEMGVGNLKVSGGAEATDLMNTTFTYDQPAWKPTVLSNLNSSSSQITVSQPANRSIFPPPSSRRYEWNLRLNSNPATNLNVRSGVGNTELNLQGLNLSRLVVNNGVGNVTIDLSGPRTQSFSVTLNGGTGQATLILPKEVGFRIHIVKGSGNLSTSGGLIGDGNYYTNQAYGKSPVTINVEIRAGVGNVRLTQS